MPGSTSDFPVLLPFVSNFEFLFITVELRMGHKKIFNPHEYGSRGLYGPSNIYFLKNHIKFEPRMIEKSWKLFQNQNSAHFTTKTFKYGTSQCLEGCTQLQKWAIYKKWQLFWKTKLHAGLAPMQKWFKGWELFYEDFNIWLTYSMCKKEFCYVSLEKSYEFSKNAFTGGPTGPPY